MTEEAQNLKLKIGELDTLNESSGWKCTLYYDPRDHSISTFGYFGNGEQPMEAFHNKTLCIGNVTNKLPEAVSEFLREREDIFSAIRECYLGEKFDGSNLRGKWKDFSPELEDDFFKLGDDLNSLPNYTWDAEGFVGFPSQGWDLYSDREVLKYGDASDLLSLASFCSIWGDGNKCDLDRMHTFLKDRYERLLFLRTMVKLTYGGTEIYCRAFWDNASAQVYITDELPNPKWEPEEDDFRSSYIQVGDCRHSINGFAELWARKEFTEEVFDSEALSVDLDPFNLNS